MSRFLGIGLLVVWGCAGEDQQAVSDGGAVELGVPEGERVSLGGISVIVPTGWEVQQPSSSMRKAQYSLGKQGGDSEDGELAVFYFGARSAGSVGANLDRWRKQITPPPRTAPSDPVTRTIGTMRVTVIDLEGSYRAGTGMRMAPGPPKANYRMVAAIVESPSGAYYFKLTGPSETVAYWRTSFAQCINSARKAG